MILLTAILPVAICGLVGAVVGLYFARKERRALLAVDIQRQTDRPQSDHRLAAI